MDLNEDDFYFSLLDEIPIEETLLYYTDKFLFNQINEWQRSGDEEAMNVGLEVYRKRQEMRKELGGKHVLYAGVPHEILSKTERGTYNIVNTIADKNLGLYITLEVKINGIEDNNRQNGNCEGAEVCNKTSYTERKEIQSSSGKRWSFNSLWRRFFQSISRYAKR